MPLAPMVLSWLGYSVAVLQLALFAMSGINLMWACLRRSSSHSAMACLALITVPMFAFSFLGLCLQPHVEGVGLVVSCSIAS